MKKITLLTNLLFLFFISLFIVSCGDDDDKGGTVDPGVPEVKPPVITDILPTTMYAIDFFEIKGENFGTEKGKILLNNSIEITASNWTDTSIRAILNEEVEPGEYMVKLQVNDTLFSNEVMITIISEDETKPLQITEVVIPIPPTVKEGDTITVNGNSFGETTGTLLIGAVGALIEPMEVVTHHWTNTQIMAEIPALGETGKYNVTVRQGDATSNSVEIIYTATIHLPQISSINPTSAKVSEIITITGTYFGDTRGDSYVMLGSKQIDDGFYIEWTNTSIKIEIPSDAETGEIKVVVDGNTSNAVTLTITQIKTPVITKLDKDEYDPGATVLITGTDFGTTRGAVFISPDIEVNIQLWGNTSIRVSLPLSQKSGQIWVVNSDGLASNKVNFAVSVNDVYPMKLISKGNFKMGNDEAVNTNESPAHPVTITYDFYMAETEVTQAQAKAVLKINKPSEWLNDNSPAISMSFAEVCEFCNDLSENRGLDKCYTINGYTITCNFDANGYRLPTEAEWEYAARAGNEGVWGFDDVSPNLYAWYLANMSGENSPKPVKGKTANKWGLYDMNGNVSEWVWDIYSTTYYQQNINGVTDPTGPTGVGGSRVIKGGSFQSGINGITGTARDSYTETTTSRIIGFRFVRKK